MAGIAVAALIIFSFLIPPDLLVFAALLVSLGASMPLVNRGEILSQFRWFMLLALAFGLVLRSTTHNNSLAWQPVHFSLGFFLILAGVSSSYSPNWLMTLLKASAFGCLLISAVLYGSLASRRPLGLRCKLIDGFYWSAVLIALACVLRAVHIIPAQAGYFAGPFGNPNSLGAFVAVIAPVLLLRSFRSLDKGLFGRAANFALLFAFFAFLVMSRSRAGMIGAFLACGWWLYFAYRKLFGLFVAGSVLSGVIVWAYFPRYIESLDQVYISKGSRYILQSREELWRGSWDAAMENPLTGVGFGISRGYSEGWQFGFQTGDAGREKGNSFLAALEEVGVLGSVFLMAPLAWSLIKAACRLTLLRRLHPPPEEFWVTLTLSACMAGGLTNAFSEAWLTAAGFFSAIMFWLVFGVLAARLTTPIRVPR